jgi:predicted patatin/cPLA2 family phospholipase
MQVFLSIRMSANIPIIFSPILHNKNYYIDGGLLDPFPYTYNKHIKRSNKCGLWLFEKYEIDFIKNNNFMFINDISDSFNYIINLLKIIHINYIKKNYKKIPNNVIYLDFNFDLNQTSFIINLEDKIKMLKIGSNRCKIFFLKIYKKNRKKYLSRKYFNIWNNKIKNKNSSIKNH